MPVFEAGLAPVVDMEPGDVIGCSALVDRDRRPVPFRVTCQTDVPAADSVIPESDTPVGRVTAGVSLPTLDCGAGCARVFAPGNRIGRTLRPALPGGEIRECRIVDLPYFDKERTIVRGIDRQIPVLRTSMAFGARSKAAS